MTLYDDTVTFITSQWAADISSHIISIAMPPLYNWEIEQSPVDPLWITIHEGHNHPRIFALHQQVENHTDCDIYFKADTEANRNTIRLELERIILMAHPSAGGFWIYNDNDNQCRPAENGSEGIIHFVETKLGVT